MNVNCMVFENRRGATLPGKRRAEKMASLYIHYPVTKEELAFLTEDELRVYCERLAILNYQGVPRYIAERVAFMLLMPEVSNPKD